MPESIPTMADHDALAALVNHLQLGLAELQERFLNVEREFDVHIAASNPHPQEVESVMGNPEDAALLPPLPAAVEAVAAAIASDPVADAIHAATDVIKSAAHDFSQAFDAYAGKVTAALTALDAITGTGGPTTPPTGTVQATAKVVDSSHMTLSWATDRNDVTSWVASRDGVDSGGSGPWSSGSLPVATRSFTFGNMVPGTSYALTITAQLAGGSTLSASATGKIPTPGDPGNPGGPTNPGSPEDGTQAAVGRSWGPVIAGDEFEYTGSPKAAVWGMYDGAGHDGNGRRTPAAYSVANGVMTCHGDRAGNTGGMAMKWSATTYRIEARMRVYNTDAGSGEQYHPVLIMWPDSDSWPQGGEDDYCEFDVGDREVSAFIHHPNQGSGSEQSSASKTIDPTQWHNYAFERTAARVTGWIDGVQWFSFSVAETNGPVPGPMHPTIQMDNFGGSSHREANQDVAFVRIYGRP